MTASAKDVSMPRIVDAEISEDGVRVTFNDGKSVVFSSSFLYQIYLEAQKLQEFQNIH